MNDIIDASTPHKEGHRIEAIHAFIAIDEDGDEVICAVQSDEGWIPLVVSDMTRIESLRPIAAEIAKMTGKTIQLRRFSKMEIVSVIHPNGVAS